MYALLFFAGFASCIALAYSLTAWDQRRARNLRRAVNAMEQGATKGVEKSAPADVAADVDNAVAADAAADVEGAIRTTSHTPLDFIPTEVLAAGFTATLRSRDRTYIVLFDDCKGVGRVFWHGDKDDLCGLLNGYKAAIKGEK